MKKYIGIIIFTLLVTTGAAYAQRMSVTVPKANIRSGPGQQYDIVWNGEKYYPIVVIEKRGDWRRFKDFEGDVGWIHKTIIDKTPTVITKNPKCNIRNGPGTKFEILFSVEKGVPFKIIGKKDKWIRVQHADGDMGWIFNALVW